MPYEFGQAAKNAKATPDISARRGATMAAPGAATPVPAGGGIPSFLTDLLKGAGKSAYEGVQNIGNIITKPFGKAMGIPEQNIGVSPETLARKTTGEKVGAGLEQVAEFMLPGTAVMKGAKAADAAIEGSRLLSGAGKLASVARGTAKVAARSGLEAASAGGVTFGRTGGDTEAAKAAALGGAIVPPAVKTLQFATKAVPFLASALSGVSRDTLRRAANPETGAKIAAAVKSVSENPSQPYFGLTNAISSSAKQAEAKAGDAVKTAISDFTKNNAGHTFDVASKADEITSALEPFRTSGLLVPRAGRGFKVAATPQSPFTTREVGELNKVLHKIQASKAIGAEDVLALKRSFATAYDAVPLGVNGNPRPYHAAVMALKDSADTAIGKILPEDLKKSFGEYSRYEAFRSKIGNKLIDANGEVKPTAEQFVSNLGNLNKGEIRKLAGEYADILGTNVEEEVQHIKDAQKLSPLFAATGSRTQDILRSLFAAGVGFGRGGGVGGAGALAATSPKVMGLASRAVSGVRAAAGKVPFAEAIGRRLGTRSFPKVAAKVAEVAPAVEKGIPSPFASMLPKAGVGGSRLRGAIEKIRRAEGVRQSRIGRPTVQAPAIPLPFGKGRTKSAFQSAISRRIKSVQ